MTDQNKPFDPTAQFAQPPAQPQVPGAPQQQPPQGWPGYPQGMAPPGYPQQPVPPPPGFMGFGPQVVMPQAPTQPAPVVQPTPPQPSQPVQAQTVEQAGDIVVSTPPLVEQAADKSLVEPTIENLSTEVQAHMTTPPLGGKTTGINMNDMLAFKDLDLDHPSVAGANVTVSWRGDMETEKVRQAFQDHGIDRRFWPIDPGPAQALKRALVEAYGGSSTYRIDPIGRGKGWGVSIKDADKLAQYLAAGDDEKLREEAKHAYTTYLTVSVQKEGDKLDLQFSPPDHPDAEKLRDLFRKHQHRVVFAEDVSVLFSNKILPAAGVTGRGQDQVWYCKKGQGLDLLKRVREALLSISTLDKDGTLILGGKVRLTAQVMTRSFIETIMDSLISDADRMLNKIDDEIDALGDKALSNRITDINRMKQDLAQHATLLGASVECITERLNKMEGKVAAARAKVWEEEAKKAQTMASQLSNGGNTVLS